MTDSRSLQLWPRGTSVVIRGNSDAYEVQDGDAWRPATEEEARQIEVEEYAERIRDNDVLACQSVLVSTLLERGDVDGFTVDDMENVYPDPSDWSLERCREYLDDNCGRDCFPDPNPWSMDRDECVELLESVSIECRDDETLDTLREAVAANIDDETLDGLDAWREAVRENGEPQEAYEWWLVSDWLCSRLRDLGEIVIDNGHGSWWGRGCTGQSMIMDGTLQQVAELSLHRIRS